jgi:hypothetical protein
MITIDAPISFLLGTGLALAASKKEPEARKEVFLKGFILQSCVLTPMILFFMLRFPDWEWNYFFNAQEFFFSQENISLGAASISILLALISASYLLGFKLATHLIDQKSQKRLMVIMGSTVGGILLIMLILIEQTLHVGTLAEFENKTAGLIFLNRDFLIAQVGAVILLGGGIFFILKPRY